MIDHPNPRDLWRGAVGSVPFNRQGTQYVLFADDFAIRGAPPNVMHPTRREYYELSGLVVVVGCDRDGEDRSLRESEARDVCARLQELAI